MGCSLLTHFDVGKENRLIFHYPVEHAPIVLQNNCYLGANCTILMGVNLGENCLVAAGSVVTKSFPANVLVAGVPAKIVKKLKTT